MKLLRLLPLLLLLLAACQGPVRPDAGLVAGALLIDVRTEAEWQQERLDGALLIPYERIGTEIARVAPDKGTKIDLYCRTGRRSGLALDELKKLGYRDVTNLGSIRDAAGKLGIPVVKGGK